jgi:hypothetical protein
MIFGARTDHKEAHKNFCMPTSSSVKTGSYKYTFIFKVAFSFKISCPIKILLFTNKLKQINKKVVILQEPTQKDVCGNAGADVAPITCDRVRTQ